MSKLLLDIYKPILIGFVVYVLVLILHKYMAKEDAKKSPSGFRVLWYYSPNMPSRTLIISLMIVAAVNLFSGFLAIVIDQVFSAEALSGRTMREVTLNAVVFGFFYYLGFGSMSFLIHDIVGENNSLSLCLAQSHNSAFIAGSLVYPLQSIGQVVSRTLAPVEPLNVYSLEWLTMIALYLGAATTTLGYGLLVGSLFMNVGQSDAPLVKIQRNQNRILLIVLAIASFGPAFAMWVNPGSLFAQSLMFNNVFVVWCSFLLISIISYMAGSYIFVSCVNRLLFTDINKRLAGVSYERDEKEERNSEQ